MDDARSRLVKCFQAVFPDLSDDQIQAATQQSVEAWDSITTITLVSVIDEEFSVELDLEDLDPLNSFESFYGRLDTERRQNR